MLDKEVIKNLNLLGITDISQLSDGDIEYWTEKKFNELRFKDYNINQKNNDLIEINNARDALLSIDYDNIKSILDPDFYKYSKKYRMNDVEYKNRLDSLINEVSIDNQSKALNGIGFRSMPVENKDQILVSKDNNNILKFISYHNKFVGILLFYLFTFTMILYNNFSFTSLLFKAQCRLDFNVLSSKQSYSSCYSGKWKIF